MEVITARRNALYGKYRYSMGDYIPPYEWANMHNTKASTASKLAGRGELWVKNGIPAVKMLGQRQWIHKDAQRKCLLKCPCQCSSK